LQKYSKDPAEAYLRGFLGRMLFSGDQPLKRVKYLSGGEKMRCMFSKLMLTEANTLLVDQPTNHLDLESIQSVNKGLLEYQGALIMTSHDHKMLNSVCNKVVEIGRYGSYVYEGTFDDYLDNERIREQKENIYNK